MGKADDGLRPIMCEHLKLLRVHCQPIETGLTGLGVADLNMCAEGKEVWVECKATDGWSVVVRPEQVGWLEARMRAGGHGFVAVRRRHDGGPRKGDACDEFWLFKGHAIRALKKEPMPHVAGLLGKWGGGPEVWPWPHIYRLLFEGR